MIDRSDAEERLYEVAEGMRHESGASSDCTKCQILDIERQVHRERQRRESRLDGLETELFDAEERVLELESRLQDVGDSSALNQITVEEQQKDLERLQETIEDLKMDRAMCEDEVARLRSYLEERIDNEEALRSQRNALLSANSELQSVLRQLV